MLFEDSFWYNFIFYLATVSCRLDQVDLLPIYSWNFILDFHFAEPAFNALPVYETNFYVLHECLWVNFLVQILANPVLLAVLQYCSDFDLVFFDLFMSQDFLVLIVFILCFHSQFNYNKSLNTKMSVNDDNSPKVDKYALFA